MRFYAVPSWRLVWQVVFDVAMVAWLVGWWLAGRATEALLRAVADPVQRAAALGADIERQLAEAATQASRVPLVGEGLRRPFDNLSGSADDVAAFAQQQAASIEQAATLAGWVVFLVPALLVLAFWLWRRLAFAVRARDTLALSNLPDGPDLLALRALATRPLPQLLAVAADPVARWRAGDAETIQRLADLERIESGVARLPSPRPTTLDG